MTFPDKDATIAFADAQSAIQALSDAYVDAINEVIEDEKLRMRVHVVAAGNVFDLMLSKVRDQLKETEPGDPNLGPQQHLDNESGSLFNRLFDDN